MLNFLLDAFDPLFRIQAYCCLYSVANEAQDLSTVSLAVTNA